MTPKHNVRGDQVRWLPVKGKNVFGDITWMPMADTLPTLLGAAITKDANRDLSSYTLSIADPVDPAKYRGLKIEQFNLVGQEDEDSSVIARVGFVGKDETTGPTPYAELSYPTACPYLFVGAVVSVLGTTIASLRSFGLQVSTDLNRGPHVAPDKWISSLTANQTVVTGAAMADVTSAAHRTALLAGTMGTISIYLALDGAASPLTITMPYAGLKMVNPSGPMLGLAQHNLVWECGMTVAGAAQISW